MSRRQRHVREPGHTRVHRRDCIVQNASGRATLLAAARSARSLPGHTRNRSACTGRRGASGERCPCGRSRSPRSRAVEAQSFRQSGEFIPEIGKGGVVCPGPGPDQQVDGTPTLPEAGEKDCAPDLPQAPPEQVPLHHRPPVSRNDGSKPRCIPGRRGAEDVEPLAAPAPPFPKKLADLVSAANPEVSREPLPTGSLAPSTRGAHRNVTSNPPSR